MFYFFTGEGRIKMFINTLPMKLRQQKAFWIKIVKNAANQIFFDTDHEVISSLPENTEKIQASS